MICRYRSDRSSSMIRSTYTDANIVHRRDSSVRAFISKRENVSSIDQDSVRELSSMYTYIHLYTCEKERDKETTLIKFTNISPSCLRTYYHCVISVDGVGLDGSQEFLVKVSAFVSFFFFFLLYQSVRMHLSFYFQSFRICVGVRCYFFLPRVFAYSSKSHARLRVRGHKFAS